jgi:hypothetical protein
LVRVARASLENALEQLFGKERIALAAPHDIGDGRGIESVWMREFKLDQGLRSALVKWPERDLRYRLLRQQPGKIAQARMVCIDFVAAMGRDDEHAPRRDTIRQVG